MWVYHRIPLLYHITRLQFFFSEPMPNYSNYALYAFIVYLQTFTMIVNIQLQRIHIFSNPLVLNRRVNVL